MAVAGEKPVEDPTHQQRLRSGGPRAGRGSAGPGTPGPGRAPQGAFRAARPGRGGRHDACRTSTAARTGPRTSRARAQSHLAIDNGASCVLNMLVPVHESASAVARFVGVGSPENQQLPPPATAGPPAEAVKDLWGPRHVLAQDPDAIAALGNDETQVVQMLLAGMPVRDIARPCFCSERSFYRRLRRIYRHLGVSGRRELEAVVRAAGDLDECALADTVSGISSESAVTVSSFSDAGMAPSDRRP